VNFFSSHIDTVSLFRNKWQSYLFFEKIGIHTPETFELSTLADPFFPLLLKPKFGSGSKNIIKIDTFRDLDYFRQKVDTAQYIAQEIVSSPEYTVDFLVGNNNELLSLVARQRIKTKDGIAVVSRTVDSSLIAPVIEKILRNIELRGPINLQYFHVEKQETLTFDLNTRFAAGGLPLSIKVGINIPLETIKLALGLPTKKLDGYAIGVTMIRYYTTLFAKDAQLGFAANGAAPNTPF
jgi:carbamoyl-phosphate synthase large subunit